MKCSLKVYTSNKTLRFFVKIFKNYPVKIYKIKIYILVFTNPNFKWDNFEGSKQTYCYFFKYFWRCWKKRYWTIGEIYLDYLFLINWLTTTRFYWFRKYSVSIRESNIFSIRDMCWRIFLIRSSGKFIRNLLRCLYKTNLYDIS